MPLEHEFVYEGRWDSQIADREALIDAIAEHEAEARRIEGQRRDHAVFEEWLNILEAKSALEAIREDPLVYVDARAESDSVTFKLEQSVDNSSLTRPGGVASRDGVVGVAETAKGIPSACRSNAVTAQHCPRRAG